MIACNNEGVWSQNGAAVAFVIEPFFYQTKWFLFLVGAGMLGAVALTVRRVATAKFRRQLARLEQQHAIERDLSLIHI